MKFFLDTANLKSIEELSSLNFCSGVTTNPSLAFKEGADSYKQLINDIVNVMKPQSKPLSIEVFTNNPTLIYDEANKLMDTYQYENLYIKVPINYENLKIIEKLKKINIKINCTCVFTLPQTLLCMQSEVDIISLFYNRIKDSGRDPNYIIKVASKKIFDLNFKSEILLGSIRYLKDIEDGAEFGAHIVTIPPKLFIESATDDGSNDSIEKFMLDVKKIKL